VGSTTALAVLPHGYVVVGSLPTRDGTADTAAAGRLIVLNSAGQPVETISGKPINGPWDMTALGNGENTALFVTNVLNGTVASKGTPTNGGTLARPLPSPSPLPLCDSRRQPIHRREEPSR
jgi:hypothetical protein